MSSEAPLTDSSSRNDPRGGAWYNTLLLFSIVVLAPTAILLILDRVVGMLGPWINLDLLVVYVASVVAARLSPRLGVWTAALGVFLILGIQILVGVGLIYIEDPALVLEYLGFAEFWPWRVIGLWAAVSVVGLLLLGFILRRVRIGRAHAFPAVLLLMAFLLLDLVSRTSIGYDIVGTNPATSSVARVTKLAMKWAHPPKFKVTPVASQSLRGDLNAQPQQPSRILSIAVESFGAAQDDRFNRAELEPLLRKLQADYVIERAMHPYTGATLAGEVRELCGLRISGTPTQAAGRLMRPNCAPAQLAAKGYATLGVHGNSRFFYNRAGLYPAIGFDHTLFYDDLRAQGRRTCQTRAFSGICDSDTLASALSFLGAHDRAFAHVMTLDTHFPLGSRTPGDHICKPGAQAPSEGLCLYENQIGAVMGEIGAAVAGAKVKPDLVYIYGDHAPPFAIASERSYFNRHQVPVVVLRRRAEPAGAAAPV